ncbi:MAG: hypothetical protein KKC20_12480 [Proteobacteria bacterium]|nr:hypothetical protein [Pseudomonadota bacterium]
MTYNFDPDKWADNEHEMLVLQLEQQTITQTRFDAAAADLEIRLQQMWRRLENTYQIPSQTDNP